MALSHLRMIKNSLKNTDPDVVPEKAHLIMVYRKSYVCLAKSVNDTIHTRHIFSRMHFVRNGEELNFNKIVWCKEGLQLANIGTNNVKED